MLSISAMVLQVAMFLVTIFLLPCSGPVGRAGFVRYTLYVALLWGCFILSTNFTNVALGADVFCKAYLAAGFAAYLLGALVCFLRWRRASGTLGAEKNHVEYLK